MDNPYIDIVNRVRIKLDDNSNFVKCYNTTPNNCNNNYYHHYNNTNDNNHSAIANSEGITSPKLVRIETVKVL